MIIPKNRGFKRQYVYGGSGIFDSISNFLTSSAAKQIASTALDLGKSAAKDVGKNVALDAGRKLVTKLLTPKSQSILQKHAVAKKAQTILSKYVGAKNINTLIDGSGQRDAVAIQDLVRKLNGSGLKMI